MTTRLHAAFVVVCTIAATTITPASWARRITLNDTGLTQCVDHQGGWTTDCAKSGQDAAYGRDVYDASPDDGSAGFSFRKVCRSGEMAGAGSCPVDPALGSGPDDWGCVYDNVSQLTWEVKTQDDGPHDYLHLFTNKGRNGRDNDRDAAWLVETTNAEVFCGATNWRLPEVIELQSIADYGYGAPNHPGPWIDPAFFPNTLASRTWAKPVVVNNSDLAFTVDFGGGYIYVVQRLERGNARLVHGADRSAALSPVSQRALSKDRFVPSADGTEVSDTMTGLVWRRCVEGMTWNDNTQTCEGAATDFPWKEALIYTRENRKGGWRIPNVKELYSIVDTERVPSIDPFAFPNMPGGPFLSSTSANYVGDVYGQVVSFGFGTVHQEEVNRFGHWNLHLVRRARE
jgi:hypothetical protein